MLYGDTFYVTEAGLDQLLELGQAGEDPYDLTEVRDLCPGEPAVYVLAVRVMGGMYAECNREDGVDFTDEDAYVFPEDGEANEYDPDEEEEYN